MTLTDKLKILDEKIKANQAQYDLGREAAKVSALYFKDLLEKYEYLTGEDLGHRPSVHEKLNLSILHWVCPLENHFKKMRQKVASNFNYDSNYRFHKLFKGYDEFKEMSLDSKYNRMNEFNKLFINFKALRPKNPKMQVKKERIMKNVNEFYEK